MAAAVKAMQGFLIVGAILKNGDSGTSGIAASLFCLRIMPVLKLQR
jgi:hypothetical protein